MEIPMVVLFAEIVLVIALGIGWIYGARRLQLKLHHRAVYPVLAIHLITVFLWMIPSGSTGIWVPSTDNLILFTHAVLGIIPILLGIVVAGAFLFTITRQNATFFRAGLNGDPLHLNTRSFIIRSITEHVCAPGEARP